MLPPEAGITEVWWKSLTNQCGVGNRRRSAVAATRIEDEALVTSRNQRCSPQATIFEGCENDATTCTDGRTAPLGRSADERDELFLGGESTRASPTISNIQILDCVPE
jgi:hypothetical protein